jgi:dTDP-glucose 4,6-dehydratase
MEKIVVVGSNSFSGAHFVDYALEQGAQVTGISRSDEPAEPFLPYKKKPAAPFAFHKFDLNKDLDCIMELIDEIKPEFVVNFSAQSMVAQSWDAPVDWYKTNTLSTILFHDRLRKCSYLKKYVHISTPEVYGSCSGIITEDAPYNPSTPYAVSRAAADMSLKTFHAVYNFPVTSTRAANVFGPGQQLYRIIPRTILYILLGKKIHLHGGGHSVRSFIHMRDVSRGTLLAARTPQTGQIYHFSTTRHISIRELVEYICKKMNVYFNSVVEASSERPGKDLAYLLDSSKAHEDLGWKPEISLEDGIDETIDWVVKNLDTLKKQPFDYIHKS